MKLSVKGFGLACAILYLFCIVWAYVMKWAGVSSLPFDLFNGFYLGWLGAVSNQALSLIVGLVVGFVDALIAGVIFAWLYNKIAKA
jgi:hypothetical protein